MTRSPTYPWTLAVALVPAALLAGCSTASSDGTPSPDSGVSAAWSPYCPVSAPRVGDPCQPWSGASGSALATCEYGDAWWDLACDVQTVCSGGHWTVYPSTDTCGASPPSNAAWCPAAASDTPSCPPPSADGGGGAASSCYYGMTACFCLIAGLPYPPPDAGYSWQCLGHGSSGCPAGRPRLGASCTGDSTCSVPGGPFGEACIGGMWQPVLGGP